jgi:UDP-2-acetamido-3-amino-2,3-dideoxy-glucuronate N-acetyltransferase
MKLIHETSDCHSPHVGEGTRIWQWVYIGKTAIIGSHCNICAQVFIEDGVLIGSNVTIKNGTQIWDGITIEDDVFVGPNVSFTNDKRPVSGNTNFIKEFTLIGKGTSIGAGSIILPGVTIGKYCTIAAGSIVVKDLPDNTHFLQKRE